MQEIQELHDKLIAERKPLLDKLNKLRAERDGAIADETLTVKRDRELVAKIKELSAQVYPMDMQVAALARALGAKSLNAKG